MPGTLPEFKTSFWNRVTYAWLNPLLRVGAKKPLEVNDLWDIDPSLTAEVLWMRFDAAWISEMQRPQDPSKLIKPTMRLLNTANAAFGRQYAFCAIWLVAQMVLTLGSSVILLYLIQWLQATQTSDSASGAWFGYVLAVTLFAAQILSTLTYNWHLKTTMRTGFFLRTSLTTALYRKSLALSSVARTRFSAGRITNIIATDTNRIDLACQFLHMLWSAPVQILLATGLLIWTIGPSALVGLAIMVAYIPFQTKITNILTRFRRGANVFADRRIKLIQEVLIGIRVIKIYAWERPFQHLISGLRRNELTQVRGFLMARASVSSITQVIPTFAMLFSFVCYALLGNELRADKIFASLSLFYSLRVPMLFLPLSLTLATDAWVAAGRIGSLLMAEELENPPEILSAVSRSDLTGQAAIEVKNALFEWEQTESAPGDLEHKKHKKGNPEEDAKPIATEAFRLDGVNLSVPPGSLVAIIGAVGSGKSSLLNALVGEMRRKSGTVTFRGTVGYCQQQAWIQNATLRDNILFGQPYDARKYANVIRVCALEHDISILPDGDQTPIGERGVNLSGGQKQRVSIARAVYFDPDIVLFDDPLSAVDAHVGRHLFEECIMGAMSRKTRILVTHQLHFLPKVDYVILMDDGKIVVQGKFCNILKSSSLFAQLMKEYGGMDRNSNSNISSAAASPDVADTVQPTDQSDVDVEDSTGPSEPISTVVAMSIRKSIESLSARKSENNKTNDADMDANKNTNSNENKKKDNGLMVSEERNIGAVSMQYYLAYIRLAGGVVVYFVVGTVLALAQSSRVMTDQWLTYWSYGRFHLSGTGYIVIYVGLGVFQILMNLSYGLAVAYFGAIASQHIHDRALQGVLSSPLSFFDGTPLGRITSRFSRDIESVDTLLPESLRVFFFSLSMTISNFVLISIVFPWFVLPLVPVLVLYYFVQAYYRMTARELKRLDSVSRSPLIAHASETLTGLATIRAYNASSRFTTKIKTLLDSNNRAYYPSLLIQRWIQLRIETINAILVFFVALFSVVFSNTISPGVAGLVIAYALQVMSTFNWTIRQATETELNMNSAERLIHYIEELEAEPLDVVKPRSLPKRGADAAIAQVIVVTSSHDEKPKSDNVLVHDSHKTPIIHTAPIDLPPSWPSSGHIVVRDLVVRYRPHLAPVINGASFAINPGEKIAIVGRTGSGKSTILSTLLRLVEPESGLIEIDGVDVCRLPLRELRSRVAVIPQEPVLFSGTVRSNLDPFDERTDADMWAALEAAGLKDVVTGSAPSSNQDDQPSTSTGLDAPVAENGENWSTGQRQLLCLARAILKRSRIVLLDEATASVDLATDEMIQHAIRNHPSFMGVTIITVAHRLNTVADYDRVLVMGAGGVVLEFDSPGVLLIKEGGVFANMVAMTGEANAKMIKEIALKKLHALTTNMDEEHDSE